MITKDESDISIYYFVGPLTDGPKTYYHLGNLLRRKPGSFYGFFPKVIKKTFKKALANRAYVRRLAIEGALTYILDPKELQTALNYGRLPKRYEVHHYLPISMGGTLNDENLCVVESRLHDALHQKILDVIYKEVHNSPYVDKDVFIVLPTKKDLLLSLEDASLFFAPKEIEFLKNQPVGFLNECGDKETEERPIQIQPKMVRVDTRVSEEIYKRLSFIEWSKKRIREQTAQNVVAVKESVQEEIHEIRRENSQYRRNRLKRIKDFNDARSMRDRVPLTRKERALISVKKARRTRTKRWNPYIKWNVKFGREYQ